MKKMRSVLGKILLILFILPSFFFAQDDPKIKETVEVVQVEVPVRVFLKGHPISDLSKEDFTLYEGKKRQSID